ncbi:hypothetical protein FHS68_001372 [Dyadobacter arcticus]|uniref:Transcriptional regulator n=1 Tax=Dyadobacter arcticus TaxID=1078754 RepID=A0ABX0UGT6_9BACT|nr:hypothetical protein [Dyadobacter arcticus]
MRRKTLERDTVCRLAVLAIAMKQISDVAVAQL